MTTSSRRPSGAPVNHQGRRLGGTANPKSTRRRPALRIHKNLMLAAGAALVIVGIMAGLLVSASPAPATAVVTGPPGPEKVPLEEGKLLASATTAARGAPVDGISCNANEQVAYHVHTHLSVYVNGVLRPIPAGIGIVHPVAVPTAHGSFDEATQCYYWLHVHAQDGVIHIESPTQRSYTLGQFFDIWHQPLGRAQVAGAKGHLTIFVNGRRYLGNPRAIRLGSRESIQIDVGRPLVAPRSVPWKGTGL